MNILALDTCFNACSVAVGLDIGGTAASKHVLCEPMQRGHAERLAQMIRQVMDMAQTDFDRLERIIVTTGPGSFTGMRVGVATARALALAADLPVIGISSMAVMALSSDINRDSGVQFDHLAVIVDARRDQVYAQLFSHDGQEIKTQPQLLSIADAAQLGGSGAIVFAGSGAEPVANAAIDAGRTVSVQTTSLQPNIGDYVWSAAQLPVGTGLVKPLYLRAPDAKPQTGKSIARA